MGSYHLTDQLVKEFDKLVGGNIFVRVYSDQITSITNEIKINKNEV